MLPSENWMNRAVSALYEPGSTFKLITLAAAFDQGITRPDEVFDCENGAIYISGHRIRDHKPFGMLTVSDILAKSSDVGAIKIALRLGAPKFYDYVRAFGFGSLTGVELPGRKPRPSASLSTGHQYRSAAISMGQEVGVTPMQLDHRGVGHCEWRVAVQAARCAELRRGETGRCAYADCSCHAQRARDPARRPRRRCGS